MSTISEKEVKIEARQLISTRSQLQDQEDENTTQPSMKYKKPIMGKFDKFEDSSNSEDSSAATRTMSTIATDEVSKYGYKEIQSTEMFDLAWWCQRRKNSHTLTS